MTPHATAASVWAADPGPALLHLTVMAFALLVLFVGLARPR
ncbi:hypothetical protein [Streptomyces sp. G-G2]|nr:hypothetical protein [Streptomyces sp. G-G2]MDJ0384796.1 hypothetical protein [Streptomyces sp. G-G2]